MGNNSCSWGCRFAIDVTSNKSIGSLLILKLNMEE